MNRSTQNRALKDLQELVAIVNDFEQDVRGILLRNKFEPARRSLPWKDGDPMKGTPAPHYGDPTGEEAVAAEERLEDIAKTISKMATAMSQWNQMVKWMKGLSGTDVVARAERTVPDCMACGKPCPGRVRSGFDERCYKRWTRAHRPDRPKFIAMVKSEQDQKEDENNASDLR